MIKCMANWPTNKKAQQNCNGDDKVTKIKCSKLISKYSKKLHKIHNTLTKEIIGGEKTKLVA